MQASFVQLDTVLPFTLMGQQRFFWCWAAVAAAARQQPPLPQCKIASEALKKNCCADSAPCDHELSLTTALGPALHQRLDGQVTFEVIKNEIGVQRKTICARIVWDPDQDGISDGAHFVVIHGYTERAGVPWVHVLDPNSGVLMGEKITYPEEVESTEMPLDDFASRYKLTGIWTHTYLLK